MIKEKIVITNELSETEMLKMLAKYNINTFVLRFMNPVEFAYRLLNEIGITMGKELIDNSKANAIYYSFLVNNNRTFEYSKSYEDAASINSSINSLRYLICEDENRTLEEKLTNDKGADLLSLYHSYCDKKEKSGLIDNIDIIRLAIEKCRLFGKTIILLDEFKLKPLELDLINKCCDYGYIVKCSFLDLFKIDKKEIKIKDFAKCYGNTNQIEYIVDYVRNNNISFDEVCIIDNQHRYNLDITNTLIKYNIPFTNGCGKSIVSSTAYAFLKLYFAWGNKEGYSAKGIKDLINSDVFNTKKLNKFLFHDDLEDQERLNRVLSICGGLKINGSGESSLLIDEYEKNLISYNDFLQSLPKGNTEEEIKMRDEYIKSKYEDNDFNNCFIKDLPYIPYVRSLNDLLSNRVEFFLLDYCVRRKNNYELDDASINVLVKEINSFYEYSHDVSHKELVDYVISHASVLAKESKPGCIMICDINNCYHCLRKYNFFIGLDSTFPSSPKENYLITDDEYVLFGDKEVVPTSINKLLESKENYMKAFKFSSSLNFNNFIVYAYFNDVEIKKYNYSSFLYDIYVKMNPNANIKDFRDYLDNNNFGYTNSKSSLEAKLIESFNHNKILPTNRVHNAYDPNLIFNTKRFTASTFAIYFECKLQFFYKMILGLNSDEEQDQYTPIKANEYGNICHDLMEYYVLYHPSKDEFEKYGRLQFELYVCGHYCVLDSLVNAKRKAFERFLEKAYEDALEIKAQDIKSELKLDDLNPYYEYKGYKLIIGGRLDRLDVIGKTSDDKYLVDVVDYKTGAIKADFKGEKTKIGNVFETLLYSYILETFGNYKVRNNIYIYTSYNDYKVIGAYDDYKEMFEDNLKQFMETIINGEFECKEKEDFLCGYCKFRKMCKEQRKSEEE